MRMAMAIAFTAAALLLVPRDIFAIGEIGIGLNAGMTYDPNNIDGRLNEINMRILGYKEATTGVKIDLLENSYMPVAGINVRYHFNYLLFRVGGHYERTWRPIRGTVNEAGVRNTVKVETSQAALPGSLCLIIPLKARTMVYMGTGLNLHYSTMTVTQSYPGGGFVTPDDPKNRYRGVFGAFHFITGIEFPLSERYTLTGEWIHLMGSSPVMRSKDGDSEISFSVNSDIIMFGINYYISI